MTDNGAEPTPVPESGAKDQTFEKEKSGRIAKGESVEIKTARPIAEVLDEQERKLNQQQAEQ